MTEIESTASGTITLWIEQLKAGDSAATEKLWNRYFSQLVQLAKIKLDSAPRAAADEEDVALSAFHSLCLGVRRGQFPRLLDRRSLWSLLVAITAHKCVDKVRFENRQKRSHRSSGGGVDEQAISQLISQQPTPEFSAMLAEQFDLLLARLTSADDPDLMRIALARMSGDSIPAIAASLGCVRRTVERKLSLILRIWEQDCQ